jgi:hypothetical protein
MYEQPNAAAKMMRGALQPRASPRSRTTGMLPAVMDEDEGGGASTRTGSGAASTRGASSAAAAAIAAEAAAALAASAEQEAALLANAATAEQLSTPPMLEARRALRAHPKILVSLPCTLWHAKPTLVLLLF